MSFHERAVRTLAVMWNTLDAGIIEDLLADDVCFESQNVYEPLEGKKRVMHYLRGKMKTVRAALPEATPYAELSEFRGKPCVLLAQGVKKNRVVVLLVETEGEQITHVDICTVAPGPWDVAPTGIYPTEVNLPEEAEPAESLEGGREESADEPGDDPADEPKGGGWANRTGRTGR